MRSYPIWINGKDHLGRRWNYVLHANTWLDGPAKALTLKRRLDMGEAAAEEHQSAIVARCAWDGSDEHLKAVDAAFEASRLYQRFSLEKRLAIVNDIRTSVVERRDEFTDILIAEGHPRKLAIWEIDGIIQGMCPETTNYVARQLETEFSDGTSRFRVVRKPDGVVCINPPQNAAASNSAFGIQVLLAGNTLVVKAPQSCPLGVYFLWRDIVAPVLQKHGAPDGTINIISGKTRSIIPAWINSPKVDDILFFGDSSTGLQIGADCVAKGKKAILELSGNDGLVVWRDADLHGASSALLECFYGSSQICMVPKFAVVHPDVADEFLDIFLAEVEKLEPGYPDDPDIVLSPVLKSSRFIELLDEARSAGVAVLSGGQRVNCQGERAVTGLFIEPTVLRIAGFELARTLRCVREETFFPLLPIVIPTRAEDGAEDSSLFQATIDFLNENPYGLRNSLWARDEAVIETFCRQVQYCGLLKINDSHIGFAPYLATHGGPRKTGGPYGESHYPALRTTHLQGICIRLGRTGARTERSF